MTTALIGASIVAFGAGSALPGPGGVEAAAALRATDSVGLHEGKTLTAAERTRSTSRSSRAQRSSGVGEPQQMPEWVRPSQGPLSSPFAARWGTFHYGLDIASPFGSTVQAASAGKVIRAGWYGGYGQVVIIDHGAGITTRYGHNSKLLVKEGDLVESGTPIAQVGSTGSSTGPHCHFEVRIDDVPTDPLPWMKDRGVDLGTVNTGL